MARNNIFGLINTQRVQFIIFFFLPDLKPHALDIL